jgi:hypothetical protein
VIGRLLRRLLDAFGRHQLSEHQAPREEPPAAKLDHYRTP